MTRSEATGKTLGVHVAIIGAGLAGIAAARTLLAAGCSARIFEKSGGVGGRCSTREVNGFVFDTGASSIAPRGRELETAMNSVSTADLAEVARPIWVHAGLRTSPGDRAKNAIKRFTYRRGNMTLPQLLAADLSICFDTAVGSFERNDNGVTVLGESFDGLIVAVPAPEAQQILLASGSSRSLGGTRYRPCLAVSLGFTAALELPYHGLLEPEQRHPLTWLSIESLKCEDRAPEGGTAMVAQLGPQFSADHFEDDEGAIVGLAVDYIEKLYGPEFGNPVAIDLMRWRYSQPENIAMFESVNRSGSRVLVAGDGLIGGRTEYAYSSGVRAAKLLMENQS